MESSAPFFFCKTTFQEIKGGEKTICCSSEPNTEAACSAKRHLLSNCEKAAGFALLLCVFSVLRSGFNVKVKVRFIGCASLPTYLSAIPTESTKTPMDRKLKTETWHDNTESKEA